MIARFWPVVGVVAKTERSISLAIKTLGKMRRCCVRSKNNDSRTKQNLPPLKGNSPKVPGSAISADQAYREADLAVDFCEDNPTSQRIRTEDKKYLKTQALLPKFHQFVNGWFGDYEALDLPIVCQFRVGLIANNEKFIFVGDSPNDEPNVSVLPKCCWRSECAKFHKSTATPAKLGDAPRKRSWICGVSGSFAKNKI